MESSKPLPHLEIDLLQSISNELSAVRMEPVELTKSYLLMNHGPVTLVSSAHGERRNVMAASWAMPLDFSPPKVAVVVDSRAYTRELIEANDECC